MTDAKRKNIFSSVKLCVFQHSTNIIMWSKRVNTVIFTEKMCYFFTFCQNISTCEAYKWRSPRNFMILRDSP